MSSLPRQYHITMLIGMLLPMGEWKLNSGRWSTPSETASNKQHCLFLPSNVSGDVMATFTLVFSVSRIQQYSDNSVQDLLRAGLSSVMHGKPLKVPEFGEINAIILLGSKTTLSSVDCLWLYKWMCVVGVTQTGHSCVMHCVRASTVLTVSNVCIIPRSQWEVILCYWRWVDRWVNM